MDIMVFLNQVFWNNTVFDYLISIAIVIMGTLILMLIKRIILKRLLEKAMQTKTPYDEAVVIGIRKYLMPILDTGVVYVALRLLVLPDVVIKIISVIFTAIILIMGALLLSTLLIYLFNQFWQSKADDADELSMRWIAVLIKIVIWAVAIMIFLDNIGVEITTLIAGLGIGGIAIAFAAQAVLEDIFSFISIFFDRPFEIDDYIMVGEMSGNVEHIGIKTTRVRSLSGEQLVFSNKDLTSSRLHNFKRMQERRVSFALGLTYDTPASELKDVPDLIQAVIDQIDHVRFDRAHFKSFGDFSLNFETVFYVNSQEYVVYMDVLQKINLGIKEAFDERGLEFAFPTQTLYLEKDGSAS